MEDLNAHVATLANSIIGVSILAMPYCFHQCGIILSIFMLLISSIISRLACHFLLKAAIISRRKTFEYLAFHIFGSLGKLAIEIGIIGFLLGTCIAFFVVMGDLGPEIISEITGTTISNTMRTSILMALALFGILPLGLLRNVDSLNGVSQATIGFYCCLVLKVMFEAIPHIVKGDWYKNINLWKPQGILQCLPIFSMALFCQTQLFEIYQALPNATLEKMNSLVRVAVNICSCVYIFVGVFGYIAFSNKLFTGNILLNFEPSFITYFMKIGFIVSVAFSFPLVIFPCRASMYSLLYKEGYSVHEGVSNYIPEGKFKALTMFIVFTSLIVGIMIPNIELVLGLIGSTIGVMICVLFPVACFICISPKNTNERLLAQCMLMIGIFVMVLGTYENLHEVDKFEPSIVTINTKIIQKTNFNIAQTEAKIIKPTTVMPFPTQKHEDVNIMPKMTEFVDVKEIRHEPPQPIEPIDDNGKNKNNKDNSKLDEIVAKQMITDKIIVEKDLNHTKNDEVDIEAIKKEEKEVEMQEEEKLKDNNLLLIDTIRKQNEVQKEIVEQQKKLMEAIKKQQIQADPNKVDKVKEEKLKAVKEIQNIALKAIEKISGKEENEELQKMEKKFTYIPKQFDHIKPNLNFDSKTKNKQDILNNNINGLNKNPSEQLSNKSLVKNIVVSPQVVDLESNTFVKKSVEKNKSIDKPVNLLYERKIESVGNSSLNNNLNNTAPLFLKLGSVDLKVSDEKEATKLIPLPVVILDKLKKKNQDILHTEKNERSKIENKKSNIPEINAMRREI